MKKGKLLSLLLAAVGGARALAMTTPGVSPGRSGRAAGADSENRGFCEGQRLGLEGRLGNFCAGP